MSRSAEAWEAQQELDALQEEELMQCEEHYAILDALQNAKNLGINVDQLITLCRAAGVSIEDLEP